ncbi:hypothetical protein, partial [Paraburkholderia caribensis]|uniref:hypothetical protein n=1 Tax=Paraburkholderia caribensis TaxID=75105 RepID=UPI00209113EA
MGFVIALHASPFVRLAFSRASGFVIALQASPFVRLAFFAGIRDALSSFTRRPCAGRHLLFFA